MHEKHEEHQGDGHELFMNVSMKGRKKEEGRASEEMAAAAAADFASLRGVLLPKSAASASAPAPSARPSASFTSQLTNTTAHYLTFGMSSSACRARVKIRSPPTARQWETAAG